MKNCDKTVQIPSDSISYDFTLSGLQKSMVEWRITDTITPYEVAIHEMEARVNNIHKGNENELVWLLEHPPIYTAGTSAKPQDLLESKRFPVHLSGRGGQYTYHGPGQRVIYVLLNLKKRQPDVRAFIFALEAWIINMLDYFKIRGERSKDQVGIWIKRSLEQAQMAEQAQTAQYKIASIGIRLRKWVSFHGVSINVSPDLGHFNGIVPCGIKNHGVTSFVDLGYFIKMSDVDMVLRKEFEKIFGATYSR